MPSTGHAIVVPETLNRILDGDGALAACVRKTVSDFGGWFAESRMVFFPEYTDHGPKHVSAVLQTALYLMSDESLGLLTPRDAGALIVATVLHDCAMHLTQDGFRRLVSGQTALRPNASFGDRPWPELWEGFRAEAVRFSAADNLRLFGSPDPVAPPDLASTDWTPRQFMLAGEFIRRHHPRFAHQVALDGFPGARGEELHVDAGLDALDGAMRDVIGTIARSHGMSLRACADHLETAFFDRVTPSQVHAVYLMALLRVGDYLQAEAPRAPAIQPRMQSLRSPLSMREFAKHHAVPYLTAHPNDPETLRAVILPQNIDSVELLQALRALFDDIQRELDGSWAVIGEVFGQLKDVSPNSRRLGLRIRRVRTTLRDQAFVNRLAFMPDGLRFQSADGKLFSLLIAPLYGNDTDAGVRELIQNSVDAVRELEAFCRRHKFDSLKAHRQALTSDVVVTREDLDGQPCLVVRDRGIGMTLEVVRDYFLKVGASYRQSSAWRREFVDDQKRSTVLRTGYFGIGALAAFLIGDELRVVTRHVTAAEGLSFTATLDSEAIQVNRVKDCPIGTTVIIPLRRELAEKDWQPHGRYRLAKPTVEILGKWPDRLLPDVTDPPTPDWQRLDPSSGLTLFWQRGGEFADRVAHNGFMVEHGDQALHVVWNDGWRGQRVLLPRLHILDREGTSPKPYLNLARTEFLLAQFEPLPGLILSVLCDFLAFVLVTTPSGLAAQSSAEPQALHPYVSASVPTETGVNFEVVHLPVVHTPRGITLFDAHTIDSLGIKTLFFCASPLLIPQLLQLESDCGVVAWFPHPIERGISWAMRTDQWPAGLNVVEENHLRVPPTKGGEGSSSVYHVSRLTLGPPYALRPDEDFMTAFKRRRALDGRDLKDPTPLRAAWERIIGQPLIPYDQAERETTLAHAYQSLAPYIQAWREIITRKQTRGR